MQVAMNEWEYRQFCDGYTMVYRTYVYQTALDMQRAILWDRLQALKNQFDQIDKKAC
jgi:hypothetical protein